MALGYEGWAKIELNPGTEDLMLCTGASIPLTRIRLESSSGYGGEIKTPVDEIGINTPNNYDWEQRDGTIQFDVHEDLVANQLRPWLFDRQKSAAITLQTRKGGQQSCDGYWNSINLTSSAGGIVTGSLGFVALTVSGSTGGDYIGNKTGDELLCNPGALNIPEPLWSANKAPVPFWNTRAKLGGSFRELTTWTLDIAQEVVKFFVCEGNPNPQEPKWIAVGPMRIDFSGSYIFVNSDTWGVPYSLASFELHVASVPFKFANLELTTSTDAVQAPSELTPIEFSYAAYELVV